MVPLVQWLGIVAPTLYAAMTAQDTLTACYVIPKYAPAKVMAKQWLDMYQTAPYWVQPFVVAGTLSNGYLAYLAQPGSLQQTLYLCSGAGMWLILMVTFAYFEPGINGACKWKVQSMLRDEGFNMPPGNGVPSSVRHSATESAKKWAGDSGIKELITGWGRRNIGRWIAAAAIAGMSGYATLCM